MSGGRGIPFSKMHGQGNDFVIIDARTNPVSSAEELARQSCDRHFGIGADGLVLICDSARADIEMRMYNPDGSRAETCGNALCCLTRQLVPEGEARTIETLANISHCSLERDDNGTMWSNVTMGKARFAGASLPVTSASTITLECGPNAVPLTPVSMGNPHGIIFADDLDPATFSQLAPMLSKHQAFSGGANISHVRRNSPEEVHVTVFERGAGWTLACGSAACAVLAAGVRRELLNTAIRLHFPGGETRVSIAEDDEITYSGQGTLVFSGTY